MAGSYYLKKGCRYGSQASGMREFVKFFGPPKVACNLHAHVSSAVLIDSHTYVC